MKTILITNDDGINSPGLAALRQALAPCGKVITVAPDRDNSAISHALTMNRPLLLQTTAADTYCLDGTPADCVAIALNKVLDHQPDLLVSGINSGPNLGDDISYSGTVSAAIEGTMYGIPSLAISLAGDKPQAYNSAQRIIYKLAEIVISQGLPADTLMNINVPGSNIKGLRITRQGRRIWKQAVQEITDPYGQIRYWIGGGSPLLDNSPDTDVQAFDQGFVSVTPIHLDITNHEGLYFFRDYLKLEKTDILENLSN